MAEKLAARAAEHAQAMAAAQTGAESVKPAVVEAQERLEREIAPVAEAAPFQPEAEAPTPERAPEPQSKRRGLSLFGRRPKTQPEERPDPLSSRMADAKPQPRPAPRSAPGAGGDLFGDQLDESELEIPAFLRRQAN